MCFASKTFYPKMLLNLYILLSNIFMIIFQTLQHLVWILGLKPVTGGALTTSATGSSSSENSSVITTAVMADLPVLSNMVTRLFESSSHLSDSSVKYLIEALCHLSEERLVITRTMMGNSFLNKDFKQSLPLGESVTFSKSLFKYL